MVNRNSHRPGRVQAGFTLVEMSVVLLIIGMILGAVSIGKDLQRDAEYMKVKQKFIDSWASAYNAFYTKAGVVVGDSQIAPSYMVNGEAGFAGTSGNTGTMVGATEPSAVCDSATPAPGGRAAIATLYSEFDRMGIRMPPGRAEGKESRYVYLDSNGNPQEIQVCFQWNKPETPSNAGNVMVISGLTPDLARAMDQMIDGKADSREGMFRQSTVDNSTVGVAGTEWQATNTHKQGSVGTSVSVAEADRKDEDQVLTVVAHYKMNQ